MSLARKRLWEYKSIITVVVFGAGNDLMQETAEYLASLVKNTPNDRTIISNLTMRNQRFSAKTILEITTLVIAVAGIATLSIAYGISGVQTRCWIS